MSNLVKSALLCFFLFGVSNCTTGHEDLPQIIYDFLDLMVRFDEPTLAEYAKFSGECGGEPELVFTLTVCRANGWRVDSEPCIDFSRKRCQAAAYEPSLQLNWFRGKFSTVGKSYQVINVQSESEDISLIEVQIGKSEFLLFYNAILHPPGGLIVGVSKIDGKKVTDYLTAL
ncbi:hypothetical protein LGV61_04980 [Desulfurispirillum indicum]|uniref:hypothetical protein n=1 Tax=Desulfurispirillum indicum TaxID=936456 RepID=UPI001CFB5F6A|nr:hypothetical protein [Desulfurispirillum indicum]UCZ57636.1 hypothetical protein LGV61_04980 [Desulfurispirillum indicum]